MRVCHVTSGHSPFDVRIFYKECQSLARAGYDVTVVAPTTTKKEEIVEGIQVLGISRPTRRRQRSRVWREIIQAVRHLDPDIVHFHDPDLLLIAPLFRPRKLIYDCHERNAAAMLTKPWLPGPLRRPLSHLVAVLEPALARLTTAIIVVDDSQLESFRDTGRPLVLVRNFPLVEGIPIREANPQDKAVVHVGAHARTRGCDVMIEAFSWVLKTVSEARLWLVGPFNHRPYEQKIRDRIAQLGVGDAVTLVGEVAYPEALRWVARARVGLVAIQPVVQYQGGLPTKMLEYMAAGIPVVAGDIPITRRILGAVECGCLVEPSSPRDYADAIVYLLTHENQAVKLGARGREAVLRAYQWSTEQENLLGLYCAVQDGQELKPSREYSIARE